MIPDASSIFKFQFESFLFFEVRTNTKSSSTFFDLDPLETVSTNLNRSGNLFAKHQPKSLIFWLKLKKVLFFFSRKWGGFSFFFSKKRDFVFLNLTLNSFIFSSHVIYKEYLRIRSNLCVKNKLYKVGAYVSNFNKLDLIPTYSVRSQKREDSISFFSTWKF